MTAGSYAAQGAVWDRRANELRSVHDCDRRRRILRRLHDDFRGIPCRDLFPLVDPRDHLCRRLDLGYPSDRSSLSTESGGHGCPCTIRSPARTWLRMSRFRGGDRASQSPGCRNSFTGRIDEPFPVLNYRTADVRAGRSSSRVSWTDPEAGSFTSAAVVLSLIAWDSSSRLDLTLPRARGPGALRVPQARSTRSGECRIR